MAIEAGHHHLSSTELKALVLGQTCRGLYLGGFRFISYIDHDLHTEGKNHLGVHNFGVCSFDDEANTMTVTWQQGWHHTTTRAYRVGNDILFFDVDTGRWRQTFSEFVPGRQTLDVS